MNIHIVEHNEGEAMALDAFKQKEYPAADSEHYKGHAPSFSRSEHTLILKDGEIIAGFITIVFNTGVVYVDSLLVAADYRRKRVGWNLVEAAEKKARSLGAHKIWLETGADWPARTFYETCGYTVRAVLPNDIGHKEYVLLDKMLEELPEHGQSIS